MKVLSALSGVGAGGVVGGRLGRSQGSVTWR
jgi:hypothetical protein